MGLTTGSICLVNKHIKKAPNGGSLTPEVAFGQFRCSFAYGECQIRKSLGIGTRFQGGKILLWQSGGTTKNNRQIAKKKTVLLIPNKMAYHEQTCLLSRRNHGLLLACFIDSNLYWHFTFDGPSILVLI